MLCGRSEWAKENKTLCTLDSYLDTWQWQGCGQQTITNMCIWDLALSQIIWKPTSGHSQLSKEACKKFLAADLYFLVASSARPIKKNYDNYEWGSVKIFFSYYTCMCSNNIIFKLAWQKIDIPAAHFSLVRVTRFGFLSFCYKIRK